MKKRSIYKLGDVFKIHLGEDIYGLGRILIVQSPGVLAGFYHQIVKNNDNVDIASLCDRQYLFRIQCGDVGLKQKKLEIVGNVPLENKVDLPLFWGVIP
ncbi:MAG TPA: Imm26 family immunity protein [Cellvibrio sp.]|nr:Imm26 family immunity protein [Cellvibrio sp.]